MGVKAAAVSVNCDTTVLAAEVRTAATSGVDPVAGVADGPQAVINKMTAMTVAISLGFMKPPVYLHLSVTFTITVMGVPK